MVQGSGGRRKWPEQAGDMQKSRAEASEDRTQDRVDQNGPGPRYAAEDDRELLILLPASLQQWDCRLTSHQVYVALEIKLGLHDARHVPYRAMSRVPKKKKKKTTVKEDQ